VSQQRPMILIRLGQRNNVRARNHQHMYRRLRLNVFKRIALLVPIDGGGGNTSFNLYPAVESSESSETIDW
jgi:hypothetical protein